MPADVVVTGADGFVGTRLVEALRVAGVPVRRAVRRPGRERGHSGDEVLTGDLESYQDWDVLLRGARVVVHLAARVHVMDRQAAREMAAFESANVLATKRLAQAAVRAGIERIVFLSTVGVHGTRSIHPLLESAPIVPASAYARSKWLAEECLRQVVAQTATDAVILRPPLVYGAGNPGNMARMMRLIATGMPLPFAGVGNARSMIYVGNLVDAIVRAIREPGPLNDTFLVCDEMAFSTPELIERLAMAAGLRVRLFYLPVPLLRMLMAMTGRSREATSLLDSLVIDSARFRNRFAWLPPFAAHAGLAEVASTCPLPAR